MVRGDADAVRQERGGGQPRVLARARDERRRRERLVHREPRDRDAAAQEADVPRRHDLRGDPRAREGRVEEQGGPRDRDRRELRATTSAAKRSATSSARCSCSSARSARPASARTRPRPDRLRQRFRWGPDHCGGRGRLSVPTRTVPTVTEGTDDSDRLRHSRTHATDGNAHRDQDDQRPRTPRRARSRPGAVRDARREPAGSRACTARENIEAQQRPA